jgi:hypothetical protein
VETPHDDYRDSYLDDSVKAAMAAGLSLNGIGIEGPMTQAAARTGGVFAYVHDPSQLPIVLRNLTAFLARDVAVSRVRIELRAPLGMFVPGRVAFGQLNLRVGPDTQLMWTVAMPI